MNILESLVLGLVQGFSEFIPISSSGHLILARELMGMTVGPNDLAYDAILQLATSFAILFYFRGEIWRLLRVFSDFVSHRPVASADKNLFLAIIIGTMPAIIAGLFLESYMETVFRDSSVVVWTLIAGAVLLFFADRFVKGDAEPNIKRGLVVGLFQTLALVPGISRSGATISGGLFAGFSRETAARFSFLLALPILLGSGLKKLLELAGSGVLSGVGMSLAIGSIAAFISGLLAIGLLLKFLKSNNLNVFVVYRIVLAVLILFFV